MGTIAFKLTDEEEAREFLYNIGFHTDYVWASTGDTPCGGDVDKFFTSYPVLIFFYDNKEITYCEYYDNTHCACPIITDKNDLFSRLKKEDKAYHDPVNHPSHYTSGKVECIDAMEQVFGTEVVKHYCLGACFKYLWRRKLKENEEQDIKKSLWYFDKFMELINK